MALKRKFGKLVLLEEIDAQNLGVTYRAARLGPTGLDRIVTLLRYSEAVSTHPDAPSRLAEQARLASRLQLPGLVRVLGIGRVERSYYASFELIEGRTLRAVIDRARREGFPFTVDNALMVASRAAAALAALHGRKDEAGQPLFHGLVRPSHLVVSWEGDVRLMGLGLWPALRETGLLGDEDRRYLAPEQRAGATGDALSDVHALSLVLLEMFTGRAPDETDPLAVLAVARHTTAAGEQELLPEPIVEILRRGLEPQLSSRYSSIDEMRAAIDTLLYSGDLSPTTFNLAFFMHSLFREEMESEAAALAEASQADYSEYVPHRAQPRTDAEVAREPAKEDRKEDSSAPAQPHDDSISSPSVEEVAAVPDAAAEEGASATGATAIAAAAAAESAPSAEPPPVPEAPAAAEPPLTSPPGPIPEPISEPEAAAPPEAEIGSSSGGGASLGDAAGFDVASPDASHRTRSTGLRGGRPREGTLKLARASGARRGNRSLMLVAALVGVVAIGGGLSYLLLGRGGPAPTAPPTTTLSPAVAAAQERVRELEARLADLEREKTETETPEDASPSPSAVQAADAEAARARAEERRRARAEAQRQAQADRARREAEIRRLEEELRSATARLVEEQQVAQGTSDLGASLPTLAAPPPTPVPVPTTTTLPPVRPGELVEGGDPGVKAPVFVSGQDARYPAAALALRREGAVVVQALVNEKGRVREAKVVACTAKGVGFEEAALAQVRSRRYRPAEKYGVPVSIWIPIRVTFSLQ